MAPPFFDAAAIDRALTWSGLVAALEESHRLPRADLGDLLLEQEGASFLNRAAWLPGRGLAVKSVTVFPGNAALEPPRPTIQGLVLLFDATSGALRALIDGAALTRLKTVADSLLGARYLAPPEPRRLLIVGAGVIAGTLARAYPLLFPSLKETAVWNRSAGRARALIAELEGEGMTAHLAAADLGAALAEADIVTCATMAEAPLVAGRRLKAGTHLDLVGAFTRTMREADDEALRRARIFVDARATTLDHIGELTIPLERGVIRREDVLGDLYDLAGGRSGGRETHQEITLFKNGGGAHLDLMTAIHIADKLEGSV